MEDYALCCQLEGHRNEVRCVHFLQNGDLCTGSRDTLIKVWSKTARACATNTEDSSSEHPPQYYQLRATLHGHKSVVGSLYSPDADSALAWWK